MTKGTTAVQEAEINYAVQPIMPAGYQLTDAGIIPKDWGTASADEFTDSNAPICYGVVQVGPNVDSGVPIVAIKYVKEISWAPLHKTSPELEMPYARSRVKEGDVLISVKGTIGRVGIVPKGFEGNISRELARIRPSHKFDGHYIAHQLESSTTQARIARAIVGTTRLEFSIGILREFQLPFPRSKSEQIAISTVLGDMDTLLQELDRLIAKKCDIKQATMQQLLTGQTRLPGFEGEWVTRELSSIADVRSGGTPSTSKAEYWDGGIAWCTPTDITALRGKKYLLATARTISKAGLRASSAELIPPMSIIMTTRATIGECAVNLAPVTTNQGFKNLVPYAVDNEFLYYLMTMQKERLLQLCSGSTFLEIGKRQLERFELYVPEDRSEQEAIATALSDIDVELQDLEMRRNKSAFLKQRMMQELLTGRTRLL